MSHLDNERAREQRRRWTRENAHLYIRADAERFMRPDAHRFMRPDAPGWVHPDAKLYDPYFRYRDRQPTEARAALGDARAAGAGTRRAFSGEVGTGSPQKMRSNKEDESEFRFNQIGIRSRPALADASGPSLGELLKLKSEGAALRLQIWLVRQEIAVRKARGLPPLRESDADWQAFLRNVARYQHACRKAGFKPDQPRVPAGNPDGGQWTDSGAADGGEPGAGGSIGRRLDRRRPG